METRPADVNSLTGRRLNLESPNSAIHGADTAGTIAVVDQKGNDASSEKYKNSWQYWALVAALSVTALLPTVEGTVVSTALPNVVQDLGGGRLYVWVVNAYFLTRYERRGHPSFASISSPYVTHSQLKTAILKFTVSPSNLSTVKQPTSSAENGSSSLLSSFSCWEVELVVEQLVSQC